MRICFSFISIFYLAFMYVEPSQHPVLMSLVGHSTQLFRDFHREVINGINLSTYFSGKYGQTPLHELYPLVAHEGRGTYLHVGAIIQGLTNFIFGTSLLNILIFPFFGVWTIIVVYLMTKEIFDEKVALFSASLLAFMPSFIIWSCINIRMTLATLSFLLTAWSLIKFRKKNSFKYIGSFLVSAYLLYVSKDKFVFPLLLASIFFFFINTRLNQKFKIISLLILLFMFMKTGAHEKIQFQFTNFKASIVETQMSYASGASGRNYKIYDDLVYQHKGHLDKVPFKTIFKALPKGLIYFLFSPFPWETDNILRLFSLPQTLFWYSTFPFCLLGIMLGLRYRYPQASFLLLFSLYWIILMSLSIGNEGTAARHRDLISPFIYIFSSVGFCKILRLSQNNFATTVPEKT